MKKGLTILLTVTTILSLTACGSSSTTTTTAAPVATEAAKETEKAGDSAQTEAAGDPTQGEKLTLKLATDQDDKFVTTIALQKFADDLAAKTDGRITVEVYSGGQLGDEKSTVEQLQFGTVDIVKCSLAPLSEFAPSLTSMNLPYLFKTKEHMWKFYNGEMGEELLKSMVGDGIIGLGWVDGGSRCFYSKKLVTKVADLKDVKTRVQESTIMMSMVESLGGIPTPIAGSEIYSALQTGVVDAAENNVPRYLDMSHDEVAPYLLLDHHQFIPESVIMSASTYNKLSEADQKLIKETMAEAIESQVEQWAVAEEEALAKCREKNLTVTELEDVSEFREACQPVYDNYFAENPEQKDFVAKIEALAD